MKLNYLLPALFCLGLITSCKDEEERIIENTVAPLNTENLSAQSFSISADRDTVIKSAEGTVLHIYKTLSLTKTVNL